MQVHYRTQRSTNERKTWNQKWY